MGGVARLCEWSLDDVMKNFRVDLSGDLSYSPFCDRESIICPHGSDRSANATILGCRGLCGGCGSVRSVDL